MIRQGARYCGVLAFTGMTLASAGAARAQETARARGTCTDDRSTRQLFTGLQRHFGWTAGVPAYAVASYVAASRVQTQRHYLSDVAFGAALGIVAGRTIGVGHGRQLTLTPLPAPRGGGVSFTLVPQK